MTPALAATVLAGLLQAAPPSSPPRSFACLPRAGAAALAPGGTVQAAGFEDHAALAAALDAAAAPLREDATGPHVEMP